MLVRVAVCAVLSVLAATSSEAQAQDSVCRVWVSVEALADGAEPPGTAVAVGWSTAAEQAFSVPDHDDAVLSRLIVVPRGVPTEVELPCGVETTLVGLAISNEPVESLVDIGAPVETATIVPSEGTSVVLSVPGAAQSSASTARERFDSARASHLAVIQERCSDPTVDCVVVPDLDEPIWIEVEGAADATGLPIVYDFGFRGFLSSITSPYVHVMVFVESAALDVRSLVASVERELRSRGGGPTDRRIAVGGRYGGYIAARAFAAAPDLFCGLVLNQPELVDLAAWIAGPGGTVREPLLDVVRLDRERGASVGGYRTRAWLYDPHLVRRTASDVEVLWPFDVASGRVDVGALRAWDRHTVSRIIDALPSTSLHEARIAIYRIPARESAAVTLGIDRFIESARAHGASVESGSRGSGAVMMRETLQALVRGADGP